MSPLLYQLSYTASFGIVSRARREPPSASFRAEGARHAFLYTIGWLWTTIPFGNFLSRSLSGIAVRRSRMLQYRTGS
jgi:hypothetical protein